MCPLSLIAMTLVLLLHNRAHLRRPVCDLLRISEVRQPPLLLRYLRECSLSVILAGLGCAWAPLLAQTTTTGSYADPSNPLGPAGPNKSADVWHVDPISGALSIRIPINTVPMNGRGPHYPYLFQYNSASTIHLSEAIPVSSPVLQGNQQSVELFWQTPSTSASTLSPMGPWVTTYGPSIYNIPSTSTVDGVPTGGYGSGQATQTTCQYSGPFLYADKDGQIHDLNLSTTTQLGRGAEGPTCPIVAPDTVNGSTTDGSSISATITGFSSAGPSGLSPGNAGSIASLLLPDGSSMAEDFNGNNIKASSDSTSWVDPEGRSVTTPSVGFGGVNISAGSYTLHTTSAAGNAQNYTVSYATQSPSWQFSLPHPQTAEVTSTVSNAAQIFTNFGTVTGISQIALPNSTAYTFSYDPVYGTISRIGFPQGGYVRFVWMIRGIGTRSLGPATRIAAESTLVASDVYLSDGSTGEKHWHYAYADMNTSTGELDTTVTKPDGTQTAYVGMPFLSSDLWQQSKETYQQTLSETMDSSGRVIRSVASVYGDGLSNGLAGEPSQVATTYFDGASPIQQQIQYQYDKYYNVTEKDESQFYSCSSTSPCTNTPPWIRRTSTAYLWNENVAAQTAHIVNKPSKVTVADGSGNAVSQTLYGYDESPLSGSNGFFNHDDANYPVSRQSGRGNLTSEAQCVSFTGNGCGSWLTTTYTYDLTGQRVSQSDPKGNTTQYYYDDSYIGGTPPGATHAYLTKVTRPLTNSVSHVSSYLYYYQTGEIGESIDENARQTNYLYADVLSRVTEIDEPPSQGNSNAQPKTMYHNVDGPGSTLTSADPIGVTRKILYDGLGRMVQQDLTSDPGTPDYVDTSYDELGRVASVSNPYRTNSVETNGTASYLYDALGRKTYQCQPNNVSNTPTMCNPSTNYLQWTYAGNVVTVHDGNGHLSKQTYDALGRLTQVLEPDASNSPMIETDYQYDALDNLTQVDQWGGPGGTPSPACASAAPGDRCRNFAYDGLSRLTFAMNPETGGTWYSYTPQGGGLCSGDLSSVCFRQDLRGMMTTYSYNDPLNRLTGKSYSNPGAPGGADPTSTPAVSYAYDTAKPGWSFIPQSLPAFSGIQQTNLIGRLSYESNSSSTIVYGYYEMGRATLKSVCTPLTCPGGDHYDMHFSYDLAGNMTTADRGLDAALNAGSPGTYYYGGLTMFYNSAGQLDSAISDNVNATNAQIIMAHTQYTPLGSLSYVELGGHLTEAFGQNALGATTAMTALGVNSALLRMIKYGPDNLGNVRDITDNLFGEYHYYYDQLNRLTGGTGPGYALVYGYDNWGNLASRTATAGSTYPFSNTPDIHNRVQFQYDPTGNVVADGLHRYSSDAENRIYVVDGPTQYLYDPEGRRVATEVNGSITNEYLYDLDGNLVSTLAPDGKLQRGFLYAGGRHWADDNGIANRTEFQIGDTTGTFTTKYDLLGNLLETCSSQPYGEALACSNGTDFSEQHFAGKKRDQESDFDYFGARYYASVLGRFMSPDPQGPTPLHLLNPQRWNMYGYGLNNPLSFTDSGGRDAAAVNFSKEIVLVGHEGVLSVHSDGTITYARFGPAGGGRLSGPGQVQSFTLSTKIQFDSSGQPTTDSLNAVKKELATSGPEKGQDPSSIRLNYFKTTDAETANLDQWIKQQQDATNRGQSPKYNVLTNNCTMFCQRGLVVGGAITQSQAANSVIVPNGFFNQLSQEPTATVTTSECDTLPDGSLRCR